MNTDLISYYKDRANKYEKIYLKPERQDELKSATSLLQNIFTDQIAAINFTGNNPVVIK